MKVKLTRHDGWDCCPSLKKAAKEIQSLDNVLYEIRNCQRASSLADLVDTFRERIKDCIEHLNDIDTDVQFKTTDDE